MGKSKRIDLIDNCKGFLICCVVLGHLCEIFTLPQGKFLYLSIYSFHMPAFVFFSGYCCSSHFDAKKMLKQYLYPYVVFQTLYMLFDRFVLAGDFAWQYTRPYWLMWYLLAMIWWNIATAFFQTQKRGRKIIAMLFVIVFGLFIGYDQNIGYLLSLSRVTVFLPFFLAGYYLKGKMERFLQWREQSALLPKLMKIMSAFAAIGIFVFIYRKQGSMLKKWFYQAVSYESGDYNIAIRLGVTAMAVILLITLCLFMPNRRVGFLTELGQHTMQVYLLHGFVVKWLGHSSQLRQAAPVFMLFLAFFSIMFVLSQRSVTRICAPLLRWR